MTPAGTFAKLGVFCRISLKYLWRYRRRYLFLFLALGFGFGVVTVISSLKDGMKENLYLSAQSHYAGDIIAMGYNTGIEVEHHLKSEEAGIIMDAAGAAGLDPRTAAVRTMVIGRNTSSVYFNGNGVTLKYVVGVDWEREADYFAKLLHPGAPGEPPGGLGGLNDDSILLSAPAARELGARRGDSVILETLTALGQKNTGVFIVGDVVEDASFFAYYKAYVSRVTLNRLIGFADGDCSLIGFFLKDRTKIETQREALYRELSGRVPTAPLVYDRGGLEDEVDALDDRAGEPRAVFLITLGVYLTEVAQLMEAIDLASYLLYGMMLVIIMVSAGVTCRLILRERTRETGTMRAMGFYESDTRFIFRLEIFVMAFFSLIAGFVLAAGINRLVSFTSFSWFPGFEVFMRNGSLSALYLPGTVAVNALAVFLALALAVWGPIFRDSRTPLPETLSGGAI
ncbi:MAG: FtsX-like permease family protein [Treponema sp.]|jgi:ABC-type lipoprotein release transport system permease subunit|nr:FtsX-like permease family protein [Treponema sp.]